MIRRLNFTGRRRISRGDVTVRVVPTSDGRLEAHVTLALEAYRLPASARVFVEAYRQTSWQRFDFGTVTSPAPAERLILRSFGTAQGVRFRVRVVEADRPEAPRILALVDGLRPLSPEGPKGGLSLLPVDWGELEGHTWRLELDEESGPLLRVSRRLVADRDAFVGSREFVSLVLPDLFRQILGQAVLAADAGDEDPDGHWAGAWLALARSLPGLSAPPPREGDALTDEEESWVDDAVERFARRATISERFAAWWSDGSG